VVIDFSARDGLKRLDEIRKEIHNKTFNNWLELIFLPIYGKESGLARSAIAEQILQFESELYRAGEISVALLASTFIMSNKLIEKERLKKLWEEIKMLDIFEIAKEEGISEGKAIGLFEGKAIGISEGKVIGISEGKVMAILEERREIVLDALIERFSLISTQVLEKIRTMQNPDILRKLSRQALKCHSIQEFEVALQQMV